MSKEQEQEKIIYEDKDVKVTNKFVYIKWYYFPWGGTKKINIKDIRKVQKKQLGFAKYRLWGMSMSHWGYWLAGDKCILESIILGLPWIRLILSRALRLKIQILFIKLQRSCLMVTQQKSKESVQLKESTK